MMPEEEIDILPPLDGANNMDDDYEELCELLAIIVARALCSETAVRKRDLVESPATN